MSAPLHRPVEDRDDLMERALELLYRHPRVERIETIGSLGTAASDRYSDIDLSVHVTGISDRAFAELIPDYLRPIGTTTIEGWGVGVLPDTYVRTLYFDAYPLFWHVDVGCISPDHIDGQDLKSTYHWPQIFKVWIDVVQDHVRGRDAMHELERLVSRWADLDVLPEDRSPRLWTILDLLHTRALGRGAPCEALFDRCDQLRRQILTSQ